MFVTILFSLFLGRSVLQQVPVYGPPCYGAGGWVLGAVSSEAWTPTDCRTAAGGGEGALGHSRQLDSTPTERQNAPLALPLLAKPPAPLKKIPTQNNWLITGFDFVGMQTQ